MLKLAFLIACMAIILVFIGWSLVRLNDIGQRGQFMQYETPTPITSIFGWARSGHSNAKTINV